MLSFKTAVEEALPEIVIWTLFLIAYLLIRCLALLERCEKHLRALHIGALGPADEPMPASGESAEERARVQADRKQFAADRRMNLGLDDGYPQRQGLQFIAFLIGISLLAWWQSWK
jgi:hypothetical protein